MNTEIIISEIERHMLPDLNNAQRIKLRTVLIQTLGKYEFPETADSATQPDKLDYLQLFLSAKQTEGCSRKTLKYYDATISAALDTIGKAVPTITTDELRCYLTAYQTERSKITVDNVRRILSSFFSWLENEDYLIKSPMRRIKKVKSVSMVKDTYTDEDLERMRDGCSTPRDLAIIDMLSSTGMRVGEMVLLDRSDINFTERECIVLGKGDKERVVYFDARTKTHLQEYLSQRTDTNGALFVSLSAPFTRLTIGGIESIVRKLGCRLDIPRPYPHKFRRTLATMAIDKGMPIEQLQKLLGHKKIDTTLHYALVKQQNVKVAYQKYLS